MAAAQGRGAVEQHRDALGRVRVLVQVDADARDAVDREGPRRRVVEVRQHPTADAGVDVAADAALDRQGGDLGDRVDDAVGVGGRRGDDEHGGVVDRRGHGGGVGAQGVGVDVDEHGPHPEELGRLVERRVRRGRDDHARVARVGRALPGGEHREQDRLGAAGGDRPGEAVRGVEQPAGEGDEVVLHPQQRGERGGVEPVRGGEHRERLEPHGIRVGQAGVVDVGQRAAAVGGQVEGLQGAQGGEHLVGRRSGRRCGHRDTSWSSRYLRRTSSETATSAAGTMVKPSAMAVCADAGWAADGVGRRDVAAEGEHPGVQERAEGEAEGLAGGPHPGVGAGAALAGAGGVGGGDVGQHREREHLAGRVADADHGDAGRGGGDPDPHGEQRGQRPAGEEQRAPEVADRACRAARRPAARAGSRAGPGRRSRRTGSSRRPRCRAAPARRSRPRRASRRWRAPAARTR